MHYCCLVCDSAKPLTGVWLEYLYRSANLTISYRGRAFTVLPQPRTSEKDRRTTNNMPLRFQTAT
jgi:hypothetical protein